MTLEMGIFNFIAPPVLQLSEWEKQSVVRIVEGSKDQKHTLDNLGACAARRFIEENVPFSVNFRPRECSKMRNHAKNPASGNVYAVFAVAIFPTAQAPRSLRRRKR